MAFFTAIFTAAATAIGFAAGTAATIGAVAAFAARTLLTIGISKLVANRAGGKATGAQDAGSRVQLPPATDNKLPVVYGSAYISPSVTDAKISTDQKTMWYVCALAEHTDTTVGSGYTFGNIYYDGRLVTFDISDPAKVVSLTNNSVTPSQTDTKVNGNLFIYLFTNGSSSGVNTSGQSAIQILQDPAIAAGNQWTSTDVMSNCAFAIVKVIYNQDAGTTNLGSLTTQLTNSLYQPGSVILDYLINTRYGCAVPLAKVDTASLTALDAYSAQNITYIPVGGGSATQARYRIDGPINTGLDCLTNLQTMVDACDSWLQYSELTGQWKVVINQSYTDYTTLGALYSVDSSNLVSGIEVNPIDLNGTYNQIEVQYPNENIRDQTDFQFLNLFTLTPSIISPNEAVNKLTLQLPIVNNAVQAKYIGLRRLYQGREDLVITFATDYSGIQVEAGDVIKVTLANYGWTDKLFRVSNVAEEKYGDGSLGARITAFEYNDTIYADGSIQDYVPSPNTGGTSDPNIIGTPAAPTVTLNTSGTINQMIVNGVVPTPGTVLFMDFNYGNTSNSAQHQFYSTVSAGNGLPYTAGANVSISSTNLPAGNVYWSVTARNLSVGVRGPSSTVTAWPGSGVTVWDGNSGGITGNNIQSNTVTSNNMTTTGVVAGCYTNPGNICIDAAGRITSAANGTPGISGIIVQEEGTTVVTANTMNFVGSSVTASNVGGVATISITSGGGGTFSYVSDNSFELDGGVNPATAINQLTSYASSRIPGDRQANASTGNFETYTFDSYYPWYTRDSLTTNGYFANSHPTIRCNPDGAGIQDIDSPVNMGGRAGWWTIIGSGIPSGYANTQQFNNFCTTQIITDANLTIQTAGWYQVLYANSVISNVIKPDTTISVTDFVANIPKVLTIDWNVEGNANTRIYSMGMCARVIGTGNAIVMTGTSLVQKPEGWTGNGYPSIYWIRP